ncbi:MAG TPA: PQQ-dependent sugar dehydrogenase [Xanthobacteraceae bacterium]|nr:PQQ-dependent sugar dehydrogenase [Xanthobacteraceae bacterium]
MNETCDMHRLIAIGLLAAACAAAPSAAQTQGSQTQGLRTREFPSSIGPLALTTVAQGLVHPWSLAFLPDGRMLVTERPGRMRIVDRNGALSRALAGVPRVHTGGQAGLLDVRLDGNYASNHVIYFCYTTNGSGAAAVARARLVEDPTPQLDEVKVIFTQRGPGGAANLGCRIVQADDGNLFVTLGDHFRPRDEAQNLANHIGKIVRIRPDGEVPSDNPFVDRAGARPEIWAYGVRNPQGLAFDPMTGRLWENEHGPRGGDEVNIIEKGKNYGWPVIGYGIDYDGTRIHASTHKSGMEQPLWYWVPSIAPSGMAFCSGELFNRWNGSIFVGALKAQLLVRLERQGDRIVKEERLLAGLGERIRDVRMGPDGALWLLTDNAAGRILRLAPLNRR